MLSHVSKPQSNPFNYKRHQWANPVSQFTAFLEHHPNKVIGRCPHNSKWISNCYGQKGLEAIETETVSCSGVSIATQEGLLVYVSSPSLCPVVSCPVLY